MKKAVRYLVALAGLVLACQTAFAGCEAVEVERDLSLFVRCIEVGDKQYQVRFRFSNDGGPNWRFESAIEQRCTCAPVAQTGQRSTDRAGDDGDLQKGVPWPVPRFTDGGRGTVFDNMTTLTWLRDTRCFRDRTFFEALSDAANLKSGDCGLSDGSRAGEWRLPSIREALSLLHYEYIRPSLPSSNGYYQAKEGNPFFGISDISASLMYWTSTTFPDAPISRASSAWVFGPYYGYSWILGKGDQASVAGERRASSMTGEHYRDHGSMPAFGRSEADAMPLGCGG